MLLQSKTSKSLLSVHFGCWVRLEEESGESHLYRIVGPDETDLQRRHISAESPVALALLGRQLDDEVLIQRPKGNLEATITEILTTAPD